MKLKGQGTRKGGPPSKTVPWSLYWVFIMFKDGPCTVQICVLPLLSTKTSTFLVAQWPSSAAPQASLERSCVWLSLASLLRGPTMKALPLCKLQKTQTEQCKLPSHVINKLWLLPCAGPDLSPLGLTSDLWERRAKELWLQRWVLLRPVWIRLWNLALPSSSPTVSYWDWGDIHIASMSTSNVKNPVAFSKSMVFWNRVPLWILNMTSSQGKSFLLVPVIVISESSMGFLGTSVVCVFHRRE